MYVLYIYIFEPYFEWNLKSDQLADFQPTFIPEVLGMLKRIANPLAYGSVFSSLESWRWNARKPPTADARVLKMVATQLRKRIEDYETGSFAPDSSWFSRATWHAPTNVPGHIFFAHKNSLQPGTTHSVSSQATEMTPKISPKKRPLPPVRGKSMGKGYDNYGEKNWDTIHSMGTCCDNLFWRFLDSIFSD